MKVVWSQANSNNGYEIREYDISTIQTRTITTTSGQILENELDIYGNIVAWREAGDIYMYDTASHKKTQVTNNGNAFQPAIYGNRIVYTLGDPSIGGNTDIYMYEISAASTTRITNSNGAFSPSIYGDKIVYADWRVYLETGEIRDIYLYDLNPEAEKLKANFITDVSSGNAPLNVSFNDISQGIPKTWHWNFGDGKNSTQQNPTHTYLSAGNYTVNLTITYLYYTNSTSATISVLDQLTSPLPIANFSANLTSGYAPLTVQFRYFTKRYWMELGLWRRS
jgi:beta propeller repeat protein